MVEFLFLSAAVACAAILLSVFLMLRPQSTLYNLPGPKSASWWKGGFVYFFYSPFAVYVFHLGNLGQIFDTQGWNFHYGIVTEYGRAVKIRGMLGVRV